MSSWTPGLIATDIDGTLLNKERRVTDETRQVIGQARQQGMIVVPCSGRHFFGTRAIAKEAGMEQAVIAGNGVQVRTWNGEIIENHPMDLNKCLELIRFFDDYQVSVNLYADDAIYTRAPNNITRYYEALNQQLGPKEQCINHLVSSLYETAEKHAANILKLEAFPLPQNIREALLTLLASLGGIKAEGTLVTSVELHNSQADKGTGLAAAARYYGIDLNRTLAFGDAENDVPMLRAAGLGVAMGNANPQAMAAADEVTLDNDHDGVAHTIRRYL